MIYMGLFQNKKGSNKSTEKSSVLKNIGNNFSNKKFSREELEEMDFEETVKRTVLNDTKHDKENRPHCHINRAVCTM